MKITPVNNSYPKTENKTNFKSAYPVYHWVAETNGSYALAISEELNRTLQRRLISIINGTGTKNPLRLAIMQRINSYLKSFDKYLSLDQVARTFYNLEGGINNKGFEAMNYMLTGAHALEFDELYGKPLGKMKAKIRDFHGVPAAELNIAKADYQRRGKSYVKKLAKAFKNENGDMQGLHVKFEIERSNSGRIKDYRLVDVRFLPEQGADNPFEKLRIKKRQSDV